MAVLVSTYMSLNILLYV